MNRPFVSSALALAAGIAVGCAGPPSFGDLPAVVLITSGLVVIAVTLKRWWRAVALVLLVLGGAARYQEKEAASIPRHLFDAIASKPGLHQVKGVISSDPSPRPFSDFYNKKISWKLVLFLDVKEIRRGRNWVNTSGKVRVTLKTEEKPGLEYGDYVWLEGKFYRPFPPTNPGQFDYRRYLERKGVYLGCSARGVGSVKVISRRAGNPVVGPALRFRGRLLENIERGMPESDASRLLAAMLLGYREKLSDRLVRSFRATNTVHILAISGLHVGLVYLIVRAVLGIFSLPRWAVSLLAIPPLLLYMVLTGMRIPVMRATLMIVIYLMAPLFGRKADLFNTVGAAAFLILLAAPAQLFDAGFQLSFAAVISIVSFTPFLERRLFKLFRLDVLPGQIYPGLLGGWPSRAGRFLLASVAVSLAACIGLSPLIAYYFNILSPITVAANIVVGLLLTAAIGIGFLSAALGFVWNAFSACLNRLNYWVLEAMIIWVKAMASIPFAYFRVRSPSPLEVVGYYGCLVLLAAVWRLNTRRLAAGLAAVFILAVVLLPSGGGAKNGLEITFLDIGQGDSAFVRLPNAATILIDGGPRTNFDSGKFIVLPFLRSRGITRLDVVVATHADMDHIGGLIAILEEVDVGRLIMPHSRHTTWTHSRLIDLIDERGVDIQFGRRGERIDLCPEVRIDILHPTGQWVDAEATNENDKSVVLRVAYGGTSAIFTGDIGEAAEDEIGENVPGIGSDILKVAHHGSKSGSSKAFLAAVRPRIAVISAGYDNNFGHPAPGVVERLISMGATVYRTDRDGAVFLKTDGDSWKCSVFCREPVRGTLKELVERSKY